VSFQRAINTAAKESGFTLIELLIVVSILVIVFSIAIPHYISTRAAAQAAGARADLKTIHSAEVSYFSGAGTGTYGTFSQLESRQLLPAGFSSGALRYERFNYTGAMELLNSSTEFRISTNPPTVNTNTPSFFLDDSGAIRYSTTGVATVASSHIGQ
jgi:type IV pilus assembly protein PilA